MRFPPEFLDELRQRVSLAGVVGRKVKLVKKAESIPAFALFILKKHPPLQFPRKKGFTTALAVVPMAIL